MERRTIKFNGEEIYLKVGRYKENNRLAIQAYTKDESFCDVSVNLSKYDLDIDTLIAIDGDCKMSGFEEKLIEENIIDSILFKVPYNYGIYDIAFLNLDRLFEYDPEGCSKHLYSSLIKVKEEEEMEAE